jgi:hypothetical protein
MMMIMKISTGRYNVRKLQPPTSLLFIRQVIREHGQTWWNITDRGEFLISLPNLSGNPTSRVI